MDINELLDKASSGDRDATESLCVLINDELRQVAARVMAARSASNEDRPTSLVQEIYLRFFAGPTLRDFKNRRYFFAAAADEINRILVDRHRHRTAAKRGGQLTREPFDIAIDQCIDDFQANNAFDIVELSEAIAKLGVEEQLLIRQYWFLGMPQKEMATLAGLSISAMSKRLTLIKAKLKGLIEGDGA